MVSSVNQLSNNKTQASALSVSQPLLSVLPSSVGQHLNQHLHSVPVHLVAQLSLHLSQRLALPVLSVRPLNQPLDLLALPLVAAPLLCSAAQQLPQEDLAQLALPSDSPNQLGVQRPHLQHLALPARSALPQVEVVSSEIRPQALLSSEIKPLPALAPVKVRQVRVASLGR